jgi:hypothetical protein
MKGDNMDVQDTVVKEDHKDDYFTGRTYQRIVEPGNGARYWIIVGHSETGAPFVALPDYKVAATMSFYGVDISYVREKLRGLTIPDAEAVTEILNEWDLEKSRSI